MPSKNKTELLKLNQWQENEYPKMDDFNDDNKKIDDAYKGIVNKLNYKADKSYVDDKINDIDFTTLENEIDKKANESHTHSANDITETTSKKFVTSSQLSNIDTITDKANKIHNHSANDITETYSKKFVTTSEKLKIKDIDGKADQEHTHSARDISETTSRNFVSDTQLSNINKITEKADKFYVDNQIITSTSDTGTKSVNNSNALLASTDARAQGGNAGVYSSRAAETNSITSAVIGSWKSQIKDTDPKYLRNTVMLASNEFEFDPSSANDNKVVGGYKGNLSWMLDSRNGEIYAKNDVYTDIKSLNSLSKSSTIVIANHDSHESSKKGADIVINRGENAAKKINDAIQSLRNTGGEIRLMEGEYKLEDDIKVDVNNIKLTGTGYATIIHGRSIAIFNKNTTISSLHISHAEKTGIWTTDNATANIQRCKISNCKLHGISVEESSTASISGCICTNNQRTGISVFNESSAAISNSNIFENISDGIYISSSSTNILIKGVALKDNHPNPEYTNQGQLNIGFHNNNNASNVFTTGCKIIDTKGNTRGVVIRGNNHALTNTQFVGKFKEKINDGGTNTNLIGNVGV